MSQGIKFLEYSFWFHKADPDSLIEIGFLFFIFGIVFLLGIGVTVYNKQVIKTYPPKNKILKPAGIGVVYLGLAGFLLIIFRYLGADFLGIRFFPLLLFLTTIAWGFYFTYKYRKNVSKDSILYEAELVKKKYLGKSR